MTEPGHLAYNVRNLQSALAFYRDALELTLSGPVFGRRGAVLTGGRTQQEPMLIEVDAPAEDAGPSPGRSRIGLYHAGWKVGDPLEDLRAAKDRLQRLGVAIDAAVDHHISRSLYVRDPDGSQVGFYVDNPDYDRRRDKDWMQRPPRPREWP